MFWSCASRCLFRSSCNEEVNSLFTQYAMVQQLTLFHAPFSGGITMTCMIRAILASEFYAFNWSQLAWFDHNQPQLLIAVVETHMVPATCALSSTTSSYICLQFERASSCTHQCPRTSSDHHGFGMLDTRAPSTVAPLGRPAKQFAYQNLWQTGLCIILQVVD